MFQRVSSKYTWANFTEDQFSLFSLILKRDVWFILASLKPYGTQATNWTMPDNFFGEETCRRSHNNFLPAAFQFIPIKLHCSLLLTISRTYFSTLLNFCSNVTRKSFSRIRCNSVCIPSDAFTCINADISSYPIHFLAICLRSTPDSYITFKVLIVILLKNSFSSVWLRVCRKILNYLWKSHETDSTSFFTFENPS